MTSKPSDASSAAIHYERANRFAAQGDLPEAIDAYQLALRSAPDFAPAGHALAQVLAHLVATVRAVGSVAAKTMFVRTVENLNVIPDAVDLRRPLLDALREPWGRPADLLGVSTAVLRRNPAILGAIKRARASWPQRLSAAQLFAGSDRAALSGDTLLRGLLEATRIADIGFERLLTNVRSVLLDQAAAGDDDLHGLDFASALAQQCYLNDYVYDLADGEAARTQALRERLAAALRDDAPITASSVAAVASYFPLHSVAGAEKLQARAWPAPIAALIQQQIAQPAEELRLRETIPRLTPIEDQVSLDVQRQYAENPYPAWVRLPRSERPSTLDEYLGELFPQRPFRALGKTASEILIAGCGTGQQALDAADLFAASRLLAIDLSLPSLAFAKRKARELGICNIEFAQADILRLDALERTFDSIEASGVLHHLADPWAGWEVLLGRLAAGGVMRVGLYSALAREDIVRGRRIIAERGYGANPDDIRRARQELIALANEQQLLFVRDSWDFYSISECRDLLFHVQEQRTTLPQIQAFLAAHDLRFLGFEVPAWLRQAYAARFPDDATHTDLDRWHRFESDNPRAFAGMYQFWVQKAGA